MDVFLRPPCHPRAERTRSESDTQRRYRDQPYTDHEMAARPAETDPYAGNNDRYR